MKTVKKIGLGLSIFISLLTFAALFQHHKAYAATTYSWQTNNVVSSAGETFKPVAGTNNFVLINSAGNGVCEASAILKVDGGGKTGTIYPLFPNADARSRAGLDNVDPYLLAQYLNKPGTCKGPASADVKNISISGTPPNSVASGGVTTCDPQTNSNCVCTDRGCTITSGTTNSGTGSSSTNACDSSESGFGFNWLLCGVLSGLGDFMDKVNHLIEGQLNFNVKQNLEDPPGIKQAWNTFRVIASALMVVIMLVMVFSQAVSIGPFDAYTVRKLLPRLVAAVIIIQVSWFFSIWLIRFANDLGQGLGGLLAAPFGGTSNLNVAKLIGNLGVGAPTTAVIGGLVTTALVLAINPFGALMFAFFIFLGILIATAVLLIRTALIIGCVIFLPVAFVAWILPGTQRYFKLLWDNFIKALLLFPLIIGVIYVGRIFAWIVGSQGGTPGIFDVLAVVIGLFGPYFLFPRMFRWGGNIMSSATSGIEKGVEKMGGEQGRKFLQSRRELLSGERLRRSQERVANKEGFDRRRPWRFPVDKLRSGQWDPTLGGRDSRIRQKKVDSYVHAGEETYQKDIEAARARVLREGQAIRARGGNWDRYFQMVADGVESYIDPDLVKKDAAGKVIDDGRVTIGRRSEVEQDAARKQTAILGSQTNWRYLEQYYKDSTDPNSGMSSEERIRARKFFDDNVSTIMPKMPHFYQGYGASADATGSSLAGMHGVEIESILGKLSDDIETAKSPEDRQNAERSLVTFLQNFNAAASNPNITLDNGALRAVKAFLDRDGGAGFRNAINGPLGPSGKPNPDARESRHLKRLNAYEDLTKLDDSTKAALNGIKVALAPRIDSDTGTLSRGSVQQPEQGAGQRGGGSFTPGPSGAYTYSPPSGESTGGFTAEQTIEHDDTQGS